MPGRLAAWLAGWLSGWQVSSLCCTLACLPAPCVSPATHTNLLSTHAAAFQAPSKPKSPAGEMAAYYLQMQPHLFREAVATAFQVGCCLMWVLA